MTGPWREPAAETEDYPGLVVHDDRVTGSITAGRSRMPLWAFVGDIVRAGWGAPQADWDIEAHGLTEDRMADFLHHLLELRGEFGRLLLVLADAERVESFQRPWWETKKHRKRVREQLLRCVEILTDTKEPSAPTEGATR